MKKRWADGHKGLVKWVHYAGVQTDNTSHSEKLISGLGAGLGILAVYWALFFYAHDSALLLLMASIAATSVLVFAVPHSPLSQPWPVMASYFISGLIGVSCAHWVQPAALAGVLAVGLSVWVMHYARCLHPPGGAAALIAVIGGPEVQQMGYSFVLIPAMINAGTLVLAGVLYNGCFAWRRYPVHRMHSQAHPHPLIKKNHLIELAVEDYQFALKQLDSFIDISPEDLAELVELAREHALSEETAAAKASRRAARGAS